MLNIGIAGVGVVLGALRTAGVPEALGADISGASLPPITTALLDGYHKEVARQLAREDRSILTDATVQCMLSAMDAFAMAEMAAKVPGESRENFGVFTSAERDRDFPVDLWNMVHQANRDDIPTVESILVQIGLLKHRVHPLGLFKKLPTNALYHLSKYFQLRGAGYPLQRMSLGGLCMLEEASAKISNGTLAGALLSAYGNMASLDNVLAFGKMGLLRKDGEANGIVPATGAASVLLEPLESMEARGAKPLAVVKRICSRFHDQMHVGRQDWLDFYGHYFADLKGTSPHVIAYDNGLGGAGEDERKAICEFFHSPTTVGYKKYTGYTGQPNNLIDLTFALFDPVIPAGQPVLLNGIGSSSGMAAMLFEKCDKTIRIPPLTGLQS